MSATKKDMSHGELEKLAKQEAVLSWEVNNRAAIAARDWLQHTYAKGFESGYRAGEASVRDYPGEPVVVDIMIMREEGSLVCGAWGRIGSETMGAIESQLGEELPDEWEDHPNGAIIRVQVGWEEAQYGDEGRMEFQGYWYCGNVISANLECVETIESGKAGQVPEDGNGMFRHFDNQPTGSDES